MNDSDLGKDTETQFKDTRKPQYTFTNPFKSRPCTNHPIKSKHEEHSDASNVGINRVERVLRDFLLFQRTKLTVKIRLE